MQLPAFFGHKRSINLLPRDAFEASTLGVVLEWALVFGKWAVIVTQLVVMGAFLWRFTLDTRLSNLKKAIAKDVAIVKSYEQVERDFTLIQKRLTVAQIALTQDARAQDVITRLSAVTPIDVWLERLSITEEAVALTAYTSSLNGFAQFLTAVQKEPLFKTVSVMQIQDGGTQGAQMQFEMSMNLGEGKKK